MIGMSIEEFKRQARLNNMPEEDIAQIVEDHLAAKIKFGDDFVPLPLEMFLTIVYD